LDHIHINTTQNVSLQYEPAGIGFRILASMLDRVFAYSYLLLIFFIFQKFLIRDSNYGDGYDKSEDYNAVMYGVMVLFLLPGLLYHLLCETFLNGQSFGKKIVGIKVVKIDGTQPNFGSYLIRSMLRLIDMAIFSPAVGIITIAATDKSQRLGDIAAGTTVIKLNSKISLGDTILYHQKPDYKIIYEQVAMLTDREANLIKEVLEFSAKQEQFQHLEKLAIKIREKLGIEEVKEGPEVFLNTLLNDYSHYKFEN